MKKWYLRISDAILNFGDAVRRLAKKVAKARANPSDKQ